MGPVAIGTLKQLRENQPPEAQQRIDTILKELEKQKDDKKPAAGGGAGASAVPSAVPAIQIENFLGDR